MPTQLAVDNGAMTLDTTTSSPAHLPAFHTDDPPEVSEYRTMSALAIVGLVFGLAAPLCFVSPLLMVIPLFGAAVSIVALRRIAASGGSLAGRGAALAALALCVASIAASLSYDRVTRYLRSNQAEQLARQWIGLLLAGNLEQAFHLTVNGVRQPSPPPPGEPVPKETPFETFTKHPLVQTVSTAGAASEVRFNGMQSYTPLGSRQVRVLQEFSIKPAASAGSPPGDPIRIILDLQRSHLAGEKTFRWLVLSFQDANAPAEAKPGV
jgi:hypothetical protein